MKRVAELIIVCSTLAAIISTFFLYRSHIFSPQQTASVIKATEPTIQENVTETTFVETTPVSTDADESVPETSPTPADTTVEKSIVIEKLPITETDMGTLTSQIQSLTNLSRSQNNLPNLTLDTALSAIAKKRSEEMIRENYFSHTSPSGCDIACQMKNSGYQTLTWGENLARSKNYHLYTVPELAQTFVTDWLKSSTHRDNLLSKKFTHQGIGIASEGQRIIITVVFAAP